MKKLINYFRQKSKISLALTGLLLLGMVAFIDSDYITGNLSLSVLYIIPIAFYAWFIGPVSTILITIISTIVEILVNKIYLFQPLIFLEGITKFLFFLVAALVIYKLKINIDEMSKLVIKLEESLNKEKEINILKTGFISIVSHEFRTPLATIQAINSIIKNYLKKMTAEEIITQHNIIEEQVNNLEKMLDDFVVMGKSEIDNIPVKSEETNLNLLCTQIIMELEISGYDISLIKFSYEGPALFCCDKGLLRQIILNLLTNALKYSSEEIIFHLICHPDKIVISVKDNGIGIPEEDKKRVYEQFFRASNVNTIAGTGLGLSIIKKSVNRSEGTIDFTSNLNQGTNFIITIPKQEAK